MDTPHKELPEMPLVEEDRPEKAIPDQYKETPKEKRAREQWKIRFNFLYVLIIALVGIFLLDLITKGASQHTETIIEIIKTLLLTASGYLFAKNSE